MSTELAKALTHRLTSRKVNDKAIEELANEISKTGFNPVDLDICTTGICVDYWIKRGEITQLMEKLTPMEKLGGIKIFPKGIIDPDRFLLRVEHAVERQF